MKVFFRYASVVLIAPFFVCLVLALFGFRVNTTESIQLGIYKEVGDAIQKGDYVVLCPPKKEIFYVARERGYLKSGNCSGSFGYMMKKILAAKGDTLTINSEGVFVNGKILSHSKPLLKDQSGREIPVSYYSNYVLNNEYLYMTDVSDTSFDARYFGVLSEDTAIKKIIPFITW